MVKTFGKALYLQARRGHRSLACRPADRLGDGDRGDRFWPRFSNDRILARKLFDRVFSRGAPPQPVGETAQDQQEQGQGDKQLAFGRHLRVILCRPLGGNKSLM